MLLTTVCFLLLALACVLVGVVMWTPDPRMCIKHEEPFDSSSSASADAAQQALQEDQAVASAMAAADAADQQQQQQAAAADSAPAVPVPALTSTTPVSTETTPPPQGLFKDTIDKIKQQMHSMTKMQLLDVSREAKVVINDLTAQEQKLETQLNNT